ncbi:hypothetical protein CLK_0378 [Clostridium botulinum A3 str. Loch Maree]|nr:hypothetical protein CLK_0378 [Clostridium botulinum A3 str. Loch Maree]
MPLIITPNLANLLKCTFIDRKPRLNPMGIIKNVTKKYSHSNF